MAKSMAGNKRAPSAQERVDQLREALRHVELATAADLARRWKITPEAVRRLLGGADAPGPIITGPNRQWAVAEAERYRSVRLQRAGGRGGRHA